MGVFDGVLEKIKAAADNLQAVSKRGDQDAASRLSLMKAEDFAARRTMEGQWQTNISFVLGNQWVQWDSMNLALVDLRAPSSRKRSVDNRLFIKVRSAVTRKLVQMRPQVVPNDSSTHAITAAHHKEKLLQAMTRNIGFDEMQVLAALWGEVCGDTYFDVQWDEDAGEMYADESGMVSEGEVGVKIRSPFEVWPGAASSVNNWGYRVWTGDLMHVDLARLKFNSNEIASDAGSLSDTKLRARLSSFFSAMAGNASSEVRKLKDMVLVLKCYELRSRKIPQGRISTFVNSIVMDETPLDWFPLVHVRNYPYFDSFYGDTNVRHSLSTQKNLNLNLSSIHEYTRTMKPKILAHENARIKSHQFDSEHNEIVTWSGPGPAPSPFNPPQMPPETWQVINHATQVIDDVWSDHPASQGKVPGSRISGAAINYLTEEDARQHTASMILWKAGISKTFEKMLDIAARNYDEGRLMTVIGDDGKINILPLQKELLGGRNRVIVSVGDGLPENKTLRAELVRRQWIDGYYGDPKDPKVRAMVQKLTGAGLVFDQNDMLLDEMRAEKENFEMAHGAMVVPDVSDDDIIHLATHHRDMKTDEYRALPDELRDLRELHCQQHEQRIMMKMAGMMPPSDEKGSKEAQATAPAVSGPVDLMKEVEQGGEPAPPPPSTAPQGEQ